MWAYLTHGLKELTEGGAICVLIGAAKTYLFGKESVAHSPLSIYVTEMEEHVFMVWVPLIILNFTLVLYLISLHSHAVVVLFN